MTQSNKTRTVRNVSDDRTIAAWLVHVEESPGFTETRYRITSGWGNPRESATEKIPPTLFFQSRQRKRHGKPYRKQDQIRLFLKGGVSDPARGRSLQTIGNDCRRRIIVDYRTRLTDCLTLFRFDVLSRIDSPFSYQNITGTNRIPCFHPKIF